MPTQLDFTGLFPQDSSPLQTEKKSSMSNRLEIIESEADFKRALKEIEKCGEWVSFDTETSGLNPFAKGAYLASVGIGTTTKDWTFPLNHYESELFEDFAWQRVRMEKLNEVMQKKKKAAQNGKFDGVFIKELYGFWWFTDFDTMLAHYNLDENERHDLKELSVKYLGVDDYDIPLSWKIGKEGSLEKHCEYLGYDVEYVTRLKRIFLRMLKEEPTAYNIFMNLTMPLSKLYTKIEHRGVPIDESKLADGKRYWEEIATSSEAALNKISKGYTPPANKKGKVPALNFGSPTQLGDLLFRYLKLKPLDKTPKGKASTSESVLKRLDHPICQNILNNREAKKNLSTFIESWKGRLDSRGRIHPTFKIPGTVTGRPSCEEPNLQQTPRDPRIRSIIDAPKGWTLCELDYSQAELRVVADLSGDPRLLEVYNSEGSDVHTLTVQEIFGILNPTGEQRKKGKAINFGFIYGMWWKKFMQYARDNYGQIFTEKESEQVRKKFFQLYAALPKWHNKQKALARAQGYVMSKIGRKRRLPDAMRPDTGQYDNKKSEAERQAINSPVQSLASDINLLAAIEIDNTIDNSYCMIVCTVHDAILVLVRNDKLDYSLRKMRRIMENPKALRTVFKCSLRVPLVADAKTGAWSLGKEYKF